jgi:hypothetical protein
MAGIAASQTKKWEPPYVEPGPNTPVWRRFNISFHIAAVVAGLASLIFFVVGMLSVRDAIAHSSEHNRIVSDYVAIARKSISINARLFQALDSLF